MTNEGINQCKQLINRYKDCSNFDEKANLRNKLFELMLPDLQKWVKTTLDKYNTFRTKEEILSWCWDGFLYSLNHYKDYITVPGHFSKYTGWYVSMSLNSERTEIKKMKKLFPISMNELTEDTEPVEEKYFGWEYDMTRFRGMLDTKHRAVFDDAILEICGATAFPGSACGFDKWRYKEVKRVYNQVIKYFIGG